MIHSSERRDVGRKIPQGGTQTYYGGLDGLKALMCVQWLRKHMIIGICSGRWNGISGVLVRGKGTILVVSTDQWIMQVC